MYGMNKSGKKEEKKNRSYNRLFLSLMMTPSKEKASCSLPSSDVRRWFPSWETIKRNLFETLPWSLRLRLSGYRGEISYDELERETLWTEYEVPMHFITLEFEDVEMERGFQVDMARRRLGTQGGDADEKNISLTLSHLSLLAFSTLLAWIKFTLWHPSETCATRLGARDTSFFQALQSEPLVALMSSSFLVWTVSVFLIYYRYSTYVNNFYLFQSFFAVISLVLFLLYEYLSVRFIPDTDVSVTMEEGISFTIVISLISVFYSLRFVHVIYLISIGSVVTALLRPLAYSSRIFRRLGFLTNEWNEGVFVVAALCILAVVIYCYESLLRKDFIMSLSLAAESESSDKILKSVLPDHVVAKLLLPPTRRSDDPASLVRRSSRDVAAAMRGEDGSGEFVGVSYSESHESVTTLFVELCGFSRTIAEGSGRESAETLSQLARLFGIFDEISEEHGVAKIKSIGDVYMAVGGLQGEGETPSAVATVQAGLEMIRRAGEVCPEVNIRCGVHTGPVIAGVIGRKRFAYDVWGDAVVIASRMQTTAGSLGRSVHVSEVTAELIKHSGFNIQCRGPQFIKGKGDMVTYQVFI
jgi:class 3 adenylate cyclase